VTAALLLGACGAGSHPPAGHRVAGRLAAAGKTPRAQEVAHPETPSLGLLALRRTLAAELRPAGAGAGAVVYDLNAHRLLFARAGDALRPPASLEKLYTSVALLRKLGPDSTLSTTILGSGRLGPRGVWHGNLYLRGGGDPSFGDETFNRNWEEGFGPTPSQLVDQLTARGIRRVAGRVIGDPSLFDARPGGPSSAYGPDIPDLGGELAGLTYDHGSTNGALSPGAFAARELVLTMRKARIWATASPSTGPTPPGARQLAAVSSPAMSVLLRLMDVPSDDFFAEMLTKQLGVRFGGAGTTSAGAGVIRSVMTGYGLHARIVDGSGLSRSDRSSPQDFVSLLRVMWGTSMGTILDSSLPVVGVSGTVARIGVRTAAQGRCLAKTGTLNDVTNLAGYCHSRGGHTLAFALLLDGPDNQRGISLLTPMVGAIAHY
jgi:D-alanyl-D-alanine carboxypeptidase/D-alanyl-D-alanine-endopeptidase (penicillin-binding protein 4)